MSTSNQAVVKRVLQETIYRVLQEIIYYHLDNYSFNNALFFAERLAAFNSHSPESSLLLGLCRFKLDDYHGALEILKPGALRTSDLGCVWIYAQSCFALKKYKDGVAALEKSRSLWPQSTRVGKARSSPRGVNPDRAALLCLLGKFHRELNDQDKAVQCFESSLKGNPFMWDAFTNLCDMGVTVSVPNAFKVTDSLVQNFDVPREGGNAGTTCDTVNSLIRKPSARATSKFKEAPGSVDSDQKTSASPVKLTSDHTADSNERKAPVSAMEELSPEAAGQTSSLPSPADSVRLRDSQPDLFRNSVRKARRQVTELATAGVLPRMSQRIASKKNSKREVGARGEEKQRVQDTLGEASLPATPTKGGKRLRSEDRPRARPLAAEEPETSLLRGSVSVSVVSANPQAPGVQDEPHEDPNTCPPRATKKARRLLPRLMPSNQKEAKDHGDEWAGDGTKLTSESCGADTAKSGMPTHENRMTNPLPLVDKRLDTTRVVDASLKWTFNILKIMGMGYYALSRFQCDKALKAYTQLPHAQGQTPWVLGQMGRAYFEQGSYSQAERVFRTLRLMAPTRHRDMELYSTVLWHLDRQAELSFLAHELLDQSWNSPEA